MGVPAGEGRRAGNPRTTWPRGPWRSTAWLGRGPACAPRPPAGSHGRSAHPACCALALGGSADDGRSDCGWPRAAQVGLPEAGPLSVTTVWGSLAYRAPETRSGQQPGPGTRSQLRAFPGAAPHGARARVRARARLVCARGAGRSGAAAVARAGRLCAARAGSRGAGRQAADGRRRGAGRVRGGRRGSGEARPVSAPQALARVPVALPGGVSPLQLSPGLAATLSASSVATW